MSNAVAVSGEVYEGSGTNLAVANGKMPVRFTKPKDVQDLLEAKMESMRSIATKHLTPEKLLKIVMVACSRTPKIVNCTPLSVLKCVMTCAELGIAPGALGAAYLVPYGAECTFIIGYRGFVELARRSDQINDIQCRVVRDGDVFEIEYGIESRFKHIPQASMDSPITHVWCLAKFKGGGYQLEVMTKQEVDAIRKRSKASGNGPWVTDYAEMAKKTCIRRAAKLWPLTPEVAAAIETADKAEFDFDMGDILGPDDGEGNALTGTRAEQLTQKLHGNPTTIGKEAAAQVEKLRERAANQNTSTASPAAGLTPPTPAAPADDDDTTSGQGDAGNAPGPEPESDDADDFLGSLGAAAMPPGPASTGGPPPRRKK